MLFTYTYVPHAMEKMQAFMDFIFFEVWCKAPTAEYDICLFEPSPPLHQIISELYKRDLSGELKEGAGKWFYESVNAIFNEFSQLNANEIDEYRQHFEANNQIEELCENNGKLAPIQYENLNPSKRVLNKQLADLFAKIYPSGFFDLSFVKRALGSDLGKYYVDFVRVNDAGCCPFCGLLPIDNEFDPTREAFDHYLPKSKYPFNSVNLRNLSPSCNKCNSGNKRDKDPLHDADGNRRVAFYPFSKTAGGFEFSVIILSNNWTNPTPEDISVSISSKSHSNEINAWDDLFRIKDRYVARCCDTSGGIYWRQRIIEESKNYGLTIEGMLDAEIKSAEAAPWVESNFLRKAFLEGCQKAGLFDDLAY